MGLVASFTTDVQQQVRRLLLWKSPVTFWLQFLAATSAVEASNMAHMDSTSPRQDAPSDVPNSPSFRICVYQVCPKASPAIWFKLPPGGDQLTSYVQNYFSGRLIKVNTDIGTAQKEKQSCKYLTLFSHTVIHLPVLFLKHSISYK